MDQQERIEQDILLYRILLRKPVTLQRIADKYHLSRERIRQIEIRVKEEFWNNIKIHLAEIDEINKKNNQLKETVMNLSEVLFKTLELEKGG